MIGRKNVNLSTQELLDRQKRYFDAIRTFAFTAVGSAEWSMKNDRTKIDQVDRQRLKDLNETIYIRYFQVNDYRERFYNELKSLDFPLYELQIDKIHNKTNSCWKQLPKDLTREYLEIFAEIDYHTSIFYQTIPKKYNLQATDNLDTSLKPTDLGRLLSIIEIKAEYNQDEAIKLLKEYNFSVNSKTIKSVINAKNTAERKMTSGNKQDVMIALNKIKHSLKEKHRIEIEHHI